MAKYGTKLTTVGIAKLANAQVSSSKVQITHIAVGDGNGVAYTPTGAETALKREQWRGTVNKAELGEGNTIIVEGIVPATVGGFTMREVGLYDADGAMIAIGNYPDTEKTTVASGVAGELILRTIIKVANTSTVDLTINADVVTATKSDIDGISAQLAQNANIITLNKFPRLAGETNDNNRLIRAFSYLNNLNGGILNVINEELDIARLTKWGIEVPSNVTIISINSIYKVLTNNQSYYGVFWIKDARNVTIDGGMFIGDRLTHTSTSGEHGCGIIVNGSLGVQIKNVTLKDFWGDGILISDTDEFQGHNDVFLQNVSIDNCRRQGISICNGKVVGENINCTNIRGTNPSAGIDVEPNNSDDLIDVYIKNLYTENCGKGMLIFPTLFNGSDKFLKVVLDTHVDKGSTLALEIAHSLTQGQNQEGFKGFITADKLYYDRNLEQAVLISGWREDNPAIKLTNLDITNANVAKSTLIPAVRINRGSTTTSYTIGNVFIDNLSIDSENCDYGVWIQDANNNVGTVKVDNIKKMNVKYSTFRNDIKALQLHGTQDLATDSFYAKSYCKKTFVKKNSNTFSAMTLQPFDLVGNEIEIINEGSSYIVVGIPAGTTIYPEIPGLVGNRGFNLMTRGKVSLTSDGINFFLRSYIGTITARNE